MYLKLSNILLPFQSSRIMLSFWLIWTSCLAFYAAGQGKEGFGEGKQDWGLLETAPSMYTFWWLHYAKSAGKSDDFSVYDRPLIVWLQGGPGNSSTGIGNFMEIGPLDLNEKPRSTTWINDYNVLFIDNPPGAGFSRVDSPASFTKNTEGSASNLIMCIENFLSKFPAFRAVPTYIFGESYGAKVAVHLAEWWNQLQLNQHINSNFRGVAVGDAWLSPKDSVSSWAPYLYQTGLLDTAGKDAVARAAQEVSDAIEKESWKEATDLYFKTQEAINKYVVKINFDNVLTKVSHSDRSERDGAEKLKKLMNEKVAKKLGLTPTFGAQSAKVFDALYSDFMQGATYHVQRLIETGNTKVVVYNTQLNLHAPTMGTVKWVDRLFQRTPEWQQASRNVLKGDSYIEGYKKSYKNFSMIWILRSGQYAPNDNPAALRTVLEFLTEQPSTLPPVNEPQSDQPFLGETSLAEIKRKLLNRVLNSF